MEEGNGSGTSSEENRWKEILWVFCQANTARLKGQVCNIKRFWKETATSSGHILDCSALSFTILLAGLPVNYDDLHTQVLIRSSNGQRIDQSQLKAFPSKPANCPETVRWLLMRSAFPSHLRCCQALTNLNSSCSECGIFWRLNWRALAAPPQRGMLKVRGECN